MNRNGMYLSAIEDFWVNTGLYQCAVSLSPSFNLDNFPNRVTHVTIFVCKDLLVVFWNIWPVLLSHERCLVLWGQIFWLFGHISILSPDPAFISIKSYFQMSQNSSLSEIPANRSSSVKQLLPVINENHGIDVNFLFGMLWNIPVP